MTRRSPASASGRASAPQRRAVRRQRQVERLARRAVRSAASIPISIRQVAPDERLAAGDPELLDAEPDERSATAARSPRTSGPARAAGTRSRGPKISLGMQYGAAEVAAVRDRDPQVAQRPAEEVLDGVRLRLDLRGHRSILPKRAARSSRARVPRSAGIRQIPVPRAFVETGAGDLQVAVRTAVRARLRGIGGCQGLGAGDNSPLTNALVAGICRKRALPATTLAGHAPPHVPGTTGTHWQYL